MKEEAINSAEVDAYISSQPAEVQQALKTLRSYILQAAPEAVELINYDIPAFALVKDGKREQQIMMAGYKKHIGFYPHPTTIEAFEESLSDYKYAKGSVQFPLNKPIPKQLVISMVDFRLAQLTP
ncbi:iron chaperone [Reinekea sp.]|uniref:iron chaperone n=1 Tax=Reinekea sp. TaxID=1970455 RepID=UPI00398941F0